MLTVDSANSVTVETGSRLHFGPLSWRSTGPEFGGLGLIIDEPRTVVTASRADQWSASGNAEAVQRLPTLFTRLEQQTDLRAAVHVESFSPSHYGFGSGTQLACAVAAAVARLAGQTLDAAALAEWTARGQRSAIGLYGFEHGGLLVDAGHGARSIGTLVSRLPFPESWGILLDETRGQGAIQEPGLAGGPEASAFADLAPMPSELTGRLCDLVLRSILPAVLDQDFATFASALTEFGRRAGQFFQVAQGGEFADMTWLDRISVLEANFPAAVAQSSWGPTVAVIVETEEHADAVKRLFPDRSFRTVRTLNTGATFRSGQQ